MCPLNRQQGELGTTHKIILQTAASIGSSLFRRVGANRVDGDVGRSVGHVGVKMGSDSGVRIGEGDEDSTAGEGKSILRRDFEGRAIDIGNWTVRIRHSGAVVETVGGPPLARIERLIDSESE